MKRMARIIFIMFVVLFLAAVPSMAQRPLTSSDADYQMEEMRKQADKEKREAMEQSRKESAEKRRARLLAEVEKLTLPADNSPKLSVKQVQISGNTLVTADELIANMPLVYNASKLPLMKAAPEELYDLREIEQVLTSPGEVRQVSTRTIQGFTQYIVSAYQSKNYGGIYAYVPREALKAGAKLEEDILPINVIEASVAAISINAYDVNQAQRAEPYLRRDVMEKWSPVKSGQVVNKKKLDDFINLLNLNPDRYVSATVSRGAEPNSLNVNYDLYETDPWHYFIQVDNSGTHDRQWKPRVGVINTNLTGRDDRLTAVAQISPESDFEDNYAVYGSYDFPLWTQKLRLAIFGGRSEFDTATVGGISWLGTGKFYGGILRYNVFQHRGWFFDLTGSLSEEESDLNPSLFPESLGSDVKWLLWSVGADIHRRTDMANSSIILNRYESMNESSEEAFERARTGAEPDFELYTISALHSQYLDTYQVNRLSGSLRWIDSDDRLVPAKMTTFGGMYTVRGYREDEIVADGGILASVQYEYDLVKHDEKERKLAGPADVNQIAAEETLPWLRKLAPLVFVDAGRAVTQDTQPGEEGTEELVSVGIGIIGQVKENFEAAAYLGWPLREAGPTDEGDPRCNFSFIARW